MEHLYERVAYLKGLADGLGISEESKEGKLLSHIVDVLEDFADAIVEINEEQNELSEYIESIDEDLAEVEDELFEEDEDEDDEFEYVELECPNCGEEVEVDEYLLYDEEVEILCPSCKEPIILSDDCCCGDHDGDCCGDHSHGHHHDGCCGDHKHD